MLFGAPLAMGKNLNAVKPAGSRVPALPGMVESMLCLRSGLAMGRPVESPKPEPGLTDQEQGPVYSLT